MQDDLAGLIERLNAIRTSNAFEAQALEDAVEALETLTRERDEARAEVETQGDEVVRLRIELADAAFDRDKATAQLTATKARLEDAVGLIQWAEVVVETHGPYDLEDKIKAFLAQQEGQSNG